MKQYAWRGYLIEVELRPFGVLLWLGAGFVVRIGEREFFPTLGDKAFSTRTDFHIEEDGQTYFGVVESTGFAMWGFGAAYRVEMAGALLAEDKQAPSRWALSLLGSLILVTILFFSCCGVAASFYWLFFLE